ncbi:MAG: glycoside hydrolase family 3 C-terminal domain-containing protein [Candidatus Delongbacteria bacterium]|nr:glycoside hydrolase family 3 C-terminal domain-containing protein [Candidatus Delongbacteria bacterium]
MEHWNDDRSIAEVESLLAEMTLDEKIGQMTQVETSFLECREDIRDYGLGSLLSGGGRSPAVNTPESWADMVEGCQKAALQTRLRIPLLYGVDAVHGHNNVKGAVIFPHNIGLGAARRPELTEEAARITARDVRATGMNWIFAPCVAVPRDERWGRTYEGFGEDPDLAAELGQAAIRGIQGHTVGDLPQVLACAKHYLGDGGTSLGRDQGDTLADQDAMRRIHLPPYIKAIQAGVGSIMVSFSSWNGAKMHASSYWLTRVLKQELGFQGLVVSDWAGITQLPGSPADQIHSAITAGLDMIMVPDTYRLFIQILKSLVREGRIPLDRIDDAVRRILRIKFQLGLFENPMADRRLLRETGSAEHRRVARCCVRESVVLLKNQAGILPLPKTLSHLLVAGKCAHDLGNQCGGWTISWYGESGFHTDGTTILEAVRQSVSPSTRLSYSPDASTIPDQPDAAIAVIGETPYAEGVGDRTDLNLDPDDQAVLTRLHQAGIPIITILISGRPLLIESCLALSQAVMAAWLPGSEGQGVTDILFGDFPPTGKLPHTWPRHLDQIPINHDQTGIDPLFPYGFGLTYPG